MPTWTELQALVRAAEGVRNSDARRHRLVALATSLGNRVPTVEGYPDEVDLLELMKELETVIRCRCIAEKRIVPGVRVHYSRGKKSGTVEYITPDGWVKLEEQPKATYPPWNLEVAAAEQKAS